MKNQNERTKHDEKERIVSNVLHSVGRSVHIDDVERSSMMLAAQLGARIALDYAFSDADPQASPRPPCPYPPESHQKTAKFGPTETRKAE